MSRQGESPEMAHPPALAEFILRITLPGREVRETILGDLREEFQARWEKDRGRACSWYRHHAVGVAFRAVRDRVLLRGWRDASPQRCSDGKAVTVMGVFEGAWLDVRFAVRSLARRPLFVGVAVLTLALGIGLNTAVFSVVHNLIQKPLPGTRSPEELVQIYRWLPGSRYHSNSIPHYLDVRDRSEAVFSGVAAWSLNAASVSAEGEAQMHLGTMVSANFFQVMGVSAEVGRAFVPEAEGGAPGASPVVMISHNLWESRYGGSTGVIGRSLLVNGQPYEIIGVVPAEFQGVLPLLRPDVWVPLTMQSAFMPGTDRFRDREDNFMQVIARLRPGVTPERAQEALDALTIQLREELPDQYREAEMLLVPQSEIVFVPEFKSAVLGMSGVMMGVVGLLLLIACVNVANLFLARAQERKREMGIRVGLGASRSRVITLLLTESLLFSLLAGGAGLLLAYLAVTALSRVTLPMDMPHSFDLPIDGSVLLFCLTTALGVGMIFGLAPALRASRPDLASALKGEAQAEGGGKSGMSRALVIVQMALSLVLLMCAGLFLQNLAVATEWDKGFDADNLLMAAMDPGLQGYEREQTEHFYAELLDHVRSYPGVTAASTAQIVPLGLSSRDAPVEVPGYEPSPGERMNIAYNRVGSGYFRAMGIPILRGRAFTEDDGPGALGVVIVNQAFADRFWPGEDPVGRRVGYAEGERTVIGVVPTGRYQSLGEVPLEFQYFPVAQSFASDRYLHVRTAAEPRDMAEPLREIVRTLDPNLPVYDVKTMNAHLGIALLPARLAGSVLSFFGVLGMGLTAVGIFGVMACWVVRRTREIGIRMAIGADRGTVTAMVLRESLRLLALGGALGFLGGLGAGQIVKSLLLTGRGLDPMSFIGAPLLLGAVALLAAYLPARKAATVDPVRALKHE